eukprot:11673694-Alexandrium_andersonii.AAC.1
MSASLVGSEMCIRDSPKRSTRSAYMAVGLFSLPPTGPSVKKLLREALQGCLLYTSDAADDM